MKLKLEDKLEIIRLYEEGYQQTRIAKKFKVQESTINAITRQYRTYGIESLKKTGKDNIYSIDFKLSIINRVLNGESKSSLANEYMINIGVIFSWVKKYQELGYNGLMTKKGRPPKMKSTKEQVKTTTNPETTDDKDKLIKEQQERIAQLEMENDLLKKLRALVQQRKKQQDEKK